MTLSFTTISPEAKFRDFFYYVREIEDGFDALSLIATGEDTLLKVELIDNNIRTSLPVEVFDGERFLEPIQRLKEEWEQVLSQPANVKSIQNQQISIRLRRQHTRGENHIVFLERAINKMERYINQLQDSTYNEHYKSTILGRFGLICERYQWQLARAHMAQNGYSAKLDQLDK